MIVSPPSSPKHMRFMGRLGQGEGARLLDADEYALTTQEPRGPT